MSEAKRFRVLIKDGRPSICSAILVSKKHSWYRWRNSEGKEWNENGCYWYGTMMDAVMQFADTQVSRIWWNKERESVESAKNAVEWALEEAFELGRLKGEIEEALACSRRERERAESNAVCGGTGCRNADVPNRVPGNNIGAGEVDGVAASEGTEDTKK